MDGLTCTREIRRLEQTGELLHHLPIIAITANARAEQVQAAFTAGVVSLFIPTCSSVEMLTCFSQDDVMLKPFKVPDLMRKIDAVG